ncbi:MAG: hypothetical protein PGN25_14990 [Methylorubrum populi]
MNRLFDAFMESSRIRFGPDPRLATPHRLALELKTLRLLDYSTSSGDGVPILVHAPFAGHTSAIADFHVRQSLMRCLQQHADGRSHRLRPPHYRDELIEAARSTHLI